MAGQSDTRIVQMQFENKQFEKNIAKSKKSLDELKSSMNFEETSKGLSKFAEGLDKLKFDGLVNNIQKLTDKFTGLGTLSELVISQIRRKIEETAASISRFVDSMTTQQMSAGMMKFEQQNKSVQTIMAATGESEEEVYRVLGRLNEYTDQTSYNFADMAQNIGKFTSVGIKLEDAERQMEGIANWAARSGAGINEASRAMYNLSQAMGVGKLTLIDWKSIENAGMATKEFKEQLIESAVAAKTIEKTVDKNGKTVYKTAKNLGKQEEVTYQNLGTMLNKGIITRNVLSSTLEKYYWDDLYYEGSDAMWKLEKAQKEALDSMIKNDQKLSTDEYKTLEQMGVFTDEAKQKLLDLAVSMGKLTQDGEKEGRKLYKAVGKNGKEISFTLSEFAESIGKSDWFDEQLIDRATTINEFAKSAYESAQKCLTFSDVLNAWKDQISTGWMNSLNIVFGSLSESMEFFSNVCNRVGEAFDKLITFRNNLLQAWADNGGRQSLIDLILGDYGKDVKTGAFGVLDIFESVGNLIRDAFVDFISLFADPLDRHMLKNEPMYITAWLGARMNEITQKVQGFMQKIRDFFTAEIEVNGQSKSRLQAVHEIIMGIVGAMQFGYQVLSNAIYFFGQIWHQLSPGFNEIIALLGDLGVSVYNTADRAQRLQTIRMIFFNLAKTLQPVSTAINTVIGSIARLIRAIFGMEDGPTDFINNIRAIGDALVSVAGIISKVVSPIITFISRIIDSITDLFRNGFDEQAMVGIVKRIISAFDEMVSAMPETVQKVVGFIRAVWNDIKNVFSSGFSQDSFSKLGGTLNEALGKIWNKIPESLRNKASEIFQTISSVFQKIGVFFVNSWNNIQALFSGVVNNKTVQNVGSSIGSFFKDLGVFIPDSLKSAFNDVVSKISGFFGNLWNRILGIFGQKEDVIDKKIAIFDQFRVSIEKIKNQIIETFFPKKQIVDRQTGTDILTSISNFLYEKLAAFQSFVQKFVGNTEGTANSFAVKFKEFAESFDWSKALLILGGALGATAIITIIAKMIKSVKAIAKGLANLGNALKEGFTLKFNSEAQKVESIGDKMLKIAAAIGILTGCIIMIGNMDATEALRGIVYVISLMAALGAMSYAMKKIYSDMSIKEASAMLLGLYGIALSISKFISALKPLAEIKDIGQFVSIFGGLTFIVGALTALGTMSKKGFFKFEKNSGLLAIAGSIALLLFALKPLKNYNPGQLATMAGSLIGILGILTVFMKLTQGMSMEKKGMNQLTSVAAAVAILVLSLRSLRNLNIGQLATMFGSLIAILGIMTLFMKMTQKISMEGTGLVQLVAMTGAIALLVFALLPLSIIKWENLAKMGAGLIATIGALVAAMAIINGMGKSFSMAGRGLAQMIAIAGAVALLVLALTPLVFIKWENLAKMGAGLIATIGALVAAMVIINKFGGSLSGKGVAGFIAIAFAVALMVLTLLPLAALDTTQLVSFCVGILAVAASMALMTKAISELELKSAIGGILAMLSLTAVILAFSVALNSVKDINWKVILAFSVGLTMMTVGMSKAIGALGKLSPSTALKGILILAAGIAAVGAAIALIAPLLMKSIGRGFQDMAANLTMISGLMQVFSGNMSGINEGNIDKGNRIIDKIGSLFEKIAGYRFSGGNVTTFRDAMANLNLTASQISLFSGKMTGISDDGNVDKAKEIIGKVKDLFTNDLQGFDGYTGLASSFSTAMYELSTALGTWAFNTSDIVSPDDSNALKTIQALASTGSGLDTIAKLNLNDLTAKISGLGGAMMLYAKGAQEVDALGVDIPEGEEMPDVSGAIKLMQAISTSLSENGGFTIPSNLPDSDSLSLFGASLAAIAGALVQFEEAGQGLGDGTTEALRVLTFFRDLRTQLESTNFSENLAALDLDAFGTGDVAEGKADQLTIFGKNISALAQSMGQFANSTTYLDESTGEIKSFDYANATTAIQNIVDAANNLPSFDGALETLTGRKESLGELSTQITVLGNALNDFHRQTTSTDDGIITEFKFDNAVEALNNLAAIPNNLPTIGGIKSWWEGNHERLSEFGTDIGQVAVGLNLFSGAVNGTSTEGGEKFDATAAAEAIGTLDSMVTLTQTLKQKLPKLGGIDSIAETLIHGRDVTLADLGDQIGKLGDGLGKLGAGIGNGNFSDNVGLKNAFDSLDSVLAVMQKLEQLSGMTGSGYANLDKLTYFVEGLTNMNQYEDGIKHNPIADSLVDFMTKINTAFIMADDDVGVFDNLMENMEIFKLFTQGLSALTNTNLDIDWGNIGTKLSTSVAAGIGNGTTDVITAVTGLMSAAQTEANSPAGVSFEPAGKSIATGVAAGILNNTTVVTRAARTMALLAYYAAMSALNAHSPSKLFADVGSYIGLGMAQGIDSTNDTVVNSMTGMTDKTIESAGTMMATLSQIMAEGADANPTITPVLDLSQVEAGMGSLNGNFGNRTIGLSTSYSASQAGQLGWGSSDDSSQNGSQYNGIYERMNQLGEELMNLGKSISNMKLVLDSGVVAGGVTDDVDLNIGRKAFYAGRNN